MTAESLREWFTVERLAESLYGIGEFRHVEEVISFLFVGSQESLLVDTGMGLYSMRALVSQISNLPCRVINTHSHFDHVGSNAEFKDIALFDHPDNRKAAQGGFDQSYLSQWTTQDQFTSSAPEKVSTYRIPAFPYARFFVDREVITIDPIELTVLHTPGHSDDSVCLFEQKRGWLFAGDLLYDGPIYIERNGGLRKFRRSLEMVAHLPLLNHIFSSHNYFEFPLEKFALLREHVDQITSQDLDEELCLQGRLRLVPA